MNGYAEVTRSLANAIMTRGAYSSQQVEVVSNMLKLFDATYVDEHDLLSDVTSAQISTLLYDHSSRPFTQADAQLFRTLADAYEDYAGNQDELSTRNVTVKVYIQSFDHSNGAMEVIELDAAEIDISVSDGSDKVTVLGRLSQHLKYKEKN